MNHKPTSASSDQKSALWLKFLICLLLINNATKGADYYWVNGAGNWSDYSNHWAVNSGGVIFHTTIPTFNDNVFFDSNSFTADSQLVYLDSTFAYCHDMDWSTVNFKVKFMAMSWPNAAIKIFGSLALSPNIYIFYCKLEFYGSALNLTLDTKGVPITSGVAFNGSGTWSLLDSIRCWKLDFNDGVFNSNNHEIHATDIGCGSSPTLAVDMGSSFIYCNNLSVFPGSNFNSANCTVTLGPNSALGTNYLSCHNHTFKKIMFIGINGVISGSIIADSIYFKGRGEIRSIQTIQNSVTCNVLICDSSASISANQNLFSLIRKAVFSEQCYFSGKIYFDTLIFTNSGFDINLIGTIEVNDTLIFNGNCSAITNIYGTSVGRIIKSSGTVVLDYVQLTGILASGGATFIASNSFDLGGNAGWQFTAPASRNLYWVNGSGEWNDNNHWSLNSGGPGGNCAPNGTDNVFFDSQSFLSTLDTIFIDYPSIYCNNFYLLANTFTPVFIKPGSLTYNFNLHVRGSLEMLSEVKFQGVFQMNSSMQGNTIQTEMNPVHLIFDGSGEWTLNSDLRSYSMIFYKGTLNSGNFKITANSIYSYNSFPVVFVNLGSSTVFCYSFNLSSIGNNLSSQNSNLVFDSTLFNYWSYFTTSNQSFNNIVFQNKAIVKGSFSCNELTFEKVDSIQSASATIQKLILNDNSYFDGTLFVDSLILNSTGKKIEFRRGSTLNVGSSLVADGISCTDINTIICDSAATINKLTGTVDLDFILLQNIHASGGAVFNATNCIDAGGNTGWNISASAARSLYWVGGEGNWSDENHWSITSGGPAGNCIPSVIDDVYFDNNSFNPTGFEAVIVDLQNVYCNNFTYNVTYSNKQFDIDGDPSFNVFGSLIFNTPSTVAGNFTNARASIKLSSPNPGNILKTSATNLNHVFVSGSGAYELQDSLRCESLTLQSGEFETSGHPVNSRRVVVSDSSAIVNFSSSILYCDTLNSFLAGSGFISNNLTIKFNDLVQRNYLKTNNQSFKKIITGNTIYGLSLAGGLACDNILFNSDVYFSASTTQFLHFGKCEIRKNFTVGNGNPILMIDSLILKNGGYTLLLREGSTIVINNAMETMNSASFPIELKSSTTNPIFIDKQSGFICMDNMIFQGVHTTGNGIFYAGANTVNLGNSSGWIYASCNPANTDVWPGDANYDLAVNNFDILNIGLAYSASGPFRSGASINWIGQPATDWSFQFANGVNLKNADCDGNGIVNYMDTTAVSVNYGSVHPPRLQNPITSAAPALQLFVIATPDTVYESDTVLVEIHLGTSAIPVDSIYGIAFTLNFDHTIIDTTYMPFDYSNCWMGVQGTNLLTFEKKFMSQGQVDIAITRTDHLNMAGSGIVVTTGVVIIDNIGARLTNGPPYINLPFTITNPRAVTAAEYYLAINSLGQEVAIDTLGTTGVMEIHGSEASMMMYPNPASDKITIHVNEQSGYELEIINSYGITILHKSIHQDNNEINIQNIPGGIYNVRIAGRNTVINRKLVVTKH